MNTENQKALLEYIRNMPEWQSALTYEQLASLNKAAADISTGTSTLEQGFADGKLRPDRYYCSDRLFRRDCNTGILDNIASALGKALAALEVLSTPVRRISEGIPFQCQIFARHLLRRAGKALYQTRLRKGEQ